MEAWVRLGLFLGSFLACAQWERWTPRRVLVQSRATRWRINLSLAVLNTLCVRLTVGALAVQAATLAAQQHWGLWHLMGLSWWGNLVLSVLLLDGAMYAQHVVSHRVPWLWRLHRVHHTDRDVDMTTGLRFHPLEILMSLGYKALLVLLLGAHPVAVVVFEGLLNTAALFNHSNLQLSARVERALHLVLITPDLHRVHHSVLASEMQSNFGFSVPWWDRCCGTYRAASSAAQPDMPLGVAEYQTATPLGFTDLVCLPFSPSGSDVRPTT